jgi:lipoate-protein ligase A
MKTLTKPIISNYYQKYMKITLGQIINSKEALQNLLNTKLPIKTSFVLNKLALALNPELENYEKRRVELVKEYGEEITKEDGTTEFKVKQENLELFVEDLAKLHAVEIDLDFTKLKIEDFGNVEIEAANLPLWILE